MIITASGGDVGWSSLLEAAASQRLWHQQGQEIGPFTIARWHGTRRTLDSVADFMHIIDDNGLINQDDVICVEGRAAVAKALPKNMAISVIGTSTGSDCRSEGHVGKAREKGCSSSGSAREGNHRMLAIKLLDPQPDDAEVFWEADYAACDRYGCARCADESGGAAFWVDGVLLGLADSSKRVCSGSCWRIPCGAPARRGNRMNSGRCTLRN